MKQVSSFKLLPGSPKTCLPHNKKTGMYLSWFAANNIPVSFQNENDKCLHHKWKSSAWHVSAWQDKIKVKLIRELSINHLHSSFKTYSRSTGMLISLWGKVFKHRSTCENSKGCVTCFIFFREIMFGWRIRPTAKYLEKRKSFLTKNSP